MFILKKGNILEVELVSELDGKFNVVDAVGNCFDSMHFHDVHDTVAEAELAQKERVIKSNFKRGKRNKKGNHVCEWCGKQGKDLTLDHITALDSFGGKKGVRKNESAWRKAWRYDNLQILCKECNESKSNLSSEHNGMTLDRIDYNARVFNNKKTIKHSIHKKSPSTKIGFGIATGKWAKNRKQLAGYVARADSNTLRLDTILDTREAYDLLPTL